MKKRRKKASRGRHSFLPLSGLSSVPDPEWLPELDWLPADEGRASRPLSSSLAWLRSPPSELLSESLRADRDEEVLLVSLRGLLEFRPATQAATRIQRQGQKKNNEEWLDPEKRHFKSPQYVRSARRHTVK